MGFKKPSENDFINAARGENLDDDYIEVKNRNKRILIYLTEDEFIKIKKESSKIGMSQNAYIRYKLFVKD